MVKRISLVAAAVTAAAVGGTLAAASPAQAASAYGCSYPRVCFYLTTSSWLDDSPTASYQDVTSSYQTLGSQSRGSVTAYNSRNDDGALLHFTNGRTYCLPPNQSASLRSIGTVDKIKIMTSANC